MPFNTVLTLFREIDSKNPRVKRLVPRIAVGKPINRLVQSARSSAVEPEAVCCTKTEGKARLKGLTLVTVMRRS